MATSGNESETSRAEDLPSVIGADLEREKTQPSFDEAPEGGARAWLVAVGAACIYFSTLGYANSFGVYQEYYMTHQLRDRSPDDIAWIGSLSSFLQFGGGLLGGPLYDRYGAWVSSTTDCYLDLLGTNIVLVRFFDPPPSFMSSV